MMFYNWDHGFFFHFLNIRPLCPVVPVRSDQILFHLPTTGYHFIHLHFHFGRFIGGTEFDVTTNKGLKRIDLLTSI